MARFIAVTDLSGKLLVRTEDLHHMTFEYCVLHGETGDRVPEDAIRMKAVGDGAYVHGEIRIGNVLVFVLGEKSAAYSWDEMRYDVFDVVNRLQASYPDIRQWKHMLEWTLHDFRQVLYAILHDSRRRAREGKAKVEKGKCKTEKGCGSTNNISLPMDTVRSMGSEELVDLSDLQTAEEGPASSGIELSEVPELQFDGDTGYHPHAYASSPVDTPPMPEFVPELVLSDISYAATIQPDPAVPEAEAPPAQGSQQ